MGVAGVAGAVGAVAEMAATDGLVVGFAGVVVLMGAAGLEGAMELERSRGLEDATVAVDEVAAVATGLETGAEADWSAINAGEPADEAAG